MLEVIGWAGGFFFAVCAAPQAIQCWRQGHAEGLNQTFMWLWFLGEVLSAVYVWGTTHPNPMWPLLANYGFNFALLLVIMRYLYWPRRPAKSE